MITIREATIADIDTIHTLIVAIANHHDQLQNVHTSPEQLQAAGFGENPQFGVLLAEVDGKIAGYTSYTWNYSIWLAAHSMNIDDVFVWEHYRSRGVGVALMLKAKQICQLRGCHRIRWEVEPDNQQAIRFYQRLGAVLRIKGIFNWDVSSSALRC